MPLQLFQVLKKKSVNPGNRPKSVKKICGRDLVILKIKKIHDRFQASSTKKKKQIIEQNDYN